MARPQILIGNGLPGYGVFPIDDPAGVEIAYAWLDKNPVSHDDGPSAVVIRVRPEHFPSLSIDGC